MIPIQHKLATTVMRKRRSRTDLIDVRATLRASMATGGVPVQVVHRKPRPTKPHLYVLADMSGSVANFAAFTVTLVSAMSQLFSRLRTFAFITTPPRSPTSSGTSATPSTPSRRSATS